MARYVANGMIQHAGREYPHGAPLDFDPPARLIELGAAVAVGEPEPAPEAEQEAPKGKRKGGR